MNIRKVEKIYKGEDKKEGAGVKIKRIFDRRSMKDTDPFLMMDFFNSKNYDDYKGGFPWHPHRGIETITYLLKGEVYHEDTLKNKGSIFDGECQWMVAGNGIMHQELMRKSPFIYGVQIWLNIFSGDKMKNPSYMDLSCEDIPVYSSEDEEVKVLAGDYKGVVSKVNREDKVRPRILDINLRGRKYFNLLEKTGRTLFLFVLDGEGELEKNILKPGEGVLYKREGEGIVVRPKTDNFRFLILSGYPLEEEIFWEGPIAMNTMEELDLAFDELNKQEFIKFRG